MAPHLLKFSIYIYTHTAGFSSKISVRGSFKKYMWWQLWNFFFLLEDMKKNFGWLWSDNNNFFSQSWQYISNQCKKVLANIFFMDMLLLMNSLCIKYVVAYEFTVKFFMDMLLLIILVSFDIPSNTIIYIHVYQISLFSCV